MADIDISGEIGWEVRANDIKEQFKGVDPEQDIEIDLTSSGGSVFQGVQIGQMVRDHKGKTTLTVGSAALSMGSHIMQNANVIKVHDDTAFMMHNPWMFTGGDHIELQKDVDLLKSLAGMLAVRYAENSGKEKKAISKLMNNTTWLFGQEIVDAGFAHEVIATENPESKEDAIGFAKLQFQECLMKLKKFEGNAEDTRQIAAMFKPAASQAQGNESTVTPKPAKPVSKQSNHEDNMTFEEFCAKYPDEAARITAWLEAEKQPDVSAMSLVDVLAQCPQAKTEQETALADAAKAVETGKLNKSEAKFLITAVASGEYGESVNDVVVDAFSGEASYREAKRTISQADESNAKFKLLQTQKGQPEPTPAGGVDAGDDTNIKGAKIQANIKNLQSEIGV